MMRIPIRYILFAALILVGMIAAVGVEQARACGGFFCQNVPVNQIAERIIFLMNEKEQRVSVIVGINYVGDANEFSWVVPVPQKPTVEVVEQATIDVLDSGTDISITAPRTYCQNITEFIYRDFGGGGGGGELGSVGPYDYAIIQNDDAQALIKWLRDNGFRVTKELEPYIEIYVKEKQYFVAFKLRRGVEVSSIQPVKLTYRSTYASIPLRLTAIAAEPDMPVLVWIFGATQYIPQNYAHPKIDYGTWRSPGRLANGDLYAPMDGSFWANVIYTDTLNTFQKQYKGQAFITQMASPTNQFGSSNGWFDPNKSTDELAGYFKNYSYVTRLRAQLSPDQMTKDPVFVAQPGLPDVSNTIDLDANPKIDPLHFWGCSSRTAIPDAIRANIPPGRTHIDELRLDVAHPANWQLSSFTVPGETPRKVWAFSNKAVTMQVINDFFVGRTTVPILLVVSVEEFNGPDGVLSDDFFTYERLLLKHLGILATEPFLERLQTPTKQPSITFRYEIGHRLVDLPRVGLLFGLLAQPGYWNTSGKMYDAMLTYARTYQKYTKADWQHTLLIDFPYYGRTSIPFPEGWIEKTLDGDATITLEKSPANSNPVFRITPLESAGIWVTYNQSRTAETSRRLNTLYGDLANVTPLSKACPSASGEYDVAPFEHGGNKGYIFRSEVAVIGAYAPIAQYAQYESTLNTMLEAYVQDMVCNR